MLLVPKSGFLVYSSSRGKLTHYKVQVEHLKCIHFIYRLDL
jgi:hypothetical protein